MPTNIRRRLAESFNNGFGKSEAAVVLVAFLAVLTFTGGASRSDVAGQMVAQLAAVLTTTYSLLRMTRPQTAAMRAPIAFCAAWAGLMVLQLVPLPPLIWTSIPGRDLFASLASLTGIEQPWRPISIFPDGTTNSLLGLTVPFAVLVAFARIRQEDWSVLLLALVAMVTFSAILGILQISARSEILYLYRVTNDGAAVGIFANRNHQALFLAVALPLLTSFAVAPRRGRGQNWRVIFAIILAFLFVPLILVTGSRAGLVLMLVGIAGSWFLHSAALSIEEFAPRQPRKLAGIWNLRREPRVLALVGGVAMMMVVTVFLARAEAVQRLFGQDLAQESRVKLFGPMLGIAKDYFPFGTGFGTFDRAFRVSEPFSNLDFTYLNHAHNDLLELIIEGGLPAIIIALVYVVWMLVRSWNAWSKPASPAGYAAIGRLGSVVASMILFASLGDYPVRTPIFAALLALASAFLAQGQRHKVAGSSIESVETRRDSKSLRFVAVK